ncbi:M48 family metallopeptidase [Nocardioides sp. AE5]|uniref:M48 family metallopeptidase n=1 Tax=Nocardioides sp. AE5 TaxID=2962573 RepID=UPI0028825198|nr:M48 family metallopeptidase [Nocardioides sp. AE5]MDT0201196.1 M48 family metallopeptidase [Nocardioides sp. AE5]
MTDTPAHHTRVAWLVTAVGAVGFLGMAALLVPWNPAPGGWPEPAAAASVFSADEVARGEEFARWNRVLSWSALGVSLLVACGLGFTRVGAGLLGGRAEQGWRSHWTVKVTCLSAVVLLIGELVTLPFGLALRSRRVNHGLTQQALPDWAVDQVKGYLLSVVVAAVALIVLVGCARRWHRWWPAVAGGICAGLVVAGSFAYPVVVEPLFNDFASMEEGPPRSEILDLARVEGVAVDDVLVADASRRTTTLNAYVSGFGSTRRVVVYDNLLESQPEDQVLSVVAHELAHAKHDDVLVGTGLGAFGVMVGIGLLGVITGSGLVRRRSGTDGLRDPRSVALVLALMAVATVLSSPVQSTISRHVEMRADTDALRVTAPEAMVELQRQLCLRSLCDPTPPAWSQFWFGSHPTVLERVALARVAAGDQSEG